MDAIALSIPKTRMIRGYPIKRAPIGAFLKAVSLLGDFPDELAGAIFPGEGVTGALKELKGMSRDKLIKTITRVLEVAPGLLLRLISSVTEIDEQRLISDPAIGLDGLAEIVTAWVEVNGIENFIRAASPLAAALKTAGRRRIGSSAISRSR